MKSVERSVAQLESVARLGDPDYRAVLWRSGLLEYGDSPNDRTWSAAALMKAGLLAVSDMARPKRPWQSVVSPAFPVGWKAPFEVLPGGPLFQLPIVANLEGDYLMGLRALERRARRSVRQVAEKPGVHLFTLLTHDKFINARHERDELRLDPEYGEWTTIRRHLDAWRKSGAEVVTAGLGVRALVHDRSWRLVPWLEEETYLSGAGRYGVRYRITLLGEGIQPSEMRPHHVLVAVPPWLRGRFTSVSAKAGEASLEPELDPGREAFWIPVSDLERLTCTFWTAEPLGPAVRQIKENEPGVRSVSLEAPDAFLNARVLIETLSSEGWTVLGGRETCISCHEDRDGLLVHGLRFERRPGGTIVPIEVTLVSSSKAIEVPSVEEVS